LIVIFGYFLSCIGLTLLFRPDPRSLLITGAMGVLVGLMVWAFQKHPRFNLLLPVLVSIVVSTLIFTITRMGFISGPANLLVAPLITFLPGSLLTTGMIELASMHILSGSSRLIYGIAVLALLFVGIAVGLNLSNLPNHQVYAYFAVSFPWWAPIVGTLLFGLGTFVRLSGANRDLFWMLLVLYIAMIAQSFGEEYFNSYMGAFLGAMMMALSSELIARSPRRTPAVVSQVLAFWFLVPGSRGLLSVTSLLTEDLQSAAIGLGEMVLLILSITLGVLVGTLLTSPHKFVPVTSEFGEFRRR
ncbi:MAG TPA: threonine/serine exporter family protein, partial [Anaerolineales bacterium]|nr:threonine/serine exporter family protein [Anaerolineales bacterium]